MALSLAGTGAALAANPVSEADRALDRALRELVTTEEGPAAAIAVVQRRNQREVHAAGTADSTSGRSANARDHMRIASVSKAFSGAAALTLVDQGVLDLPDTIGARLPDLPAQWHGVTLGQLLAHTSGLPDFTASDGFGPALNASPQLAPPPRDLLGFVEDLPLNFAPGSEYRYSNSDNIAVGLMIEAVTGARYQHALRTKVLDPHGLRRTRMAEGVELPDPFLHGYAIAESGDREDVSQLVAFGGWAWASGGIVSTPANLNRFVRAYVGGGMFGAETRRRQHRFAAGANSEPRGPGRNAAGLGLFRYRTPCGTMFGHTGSIFGYTQLVAASRSGHRSITFSITQQVSDDLLPELRKAQGLAVCAALAR